MALKSYIMERFQRNKGARQHGKKLALELRFVPFQSPGSSLFRKNATRVEELKAVVHATLQVPHLWRFSFVQPIMTYELTFSCVTSDSLSMLFSAEAHGQLTPAGKKKATRGPAAPKQKQAISFRAGMIKVFIIRSHAWDPGLCKS